MPAIRFSSLFGLLLFISACVTINVYFPTAEAVEAADRIIRDVYGEEKPAQPAPETTPNAPAPDSSRALPGGEPLFVRALEWLVAPGPGRRRYRHFLAGHPGDPHFDGSALRLAETVFHQR